MPPIHPMRLEHPHDLLRDYRVVISLTVEWGDQDGFAHVNNTVYLKWCETARVVYLEQVEMWQMIGAVGKGPILAALSCNYLHPVTFPDTVQIGARVGKIGNSSFCMEHALVSLKQNAVVADSSSVLVFLEYKGSLPLRVPDSIREAMAQLEGRPLSQLT
jgi:acyl-CoA thioester hydrolase